MDFLKWLAAGAIGGAIGAAIWVAVGYFSGYEVGWIAWGVGFLAGVGVRIAAQDEEGLAPGLAATAVAVGAVFLGKYFVVSLAVGDLSSQFAEIELDRTDMISSVADEIAGEHDEAGKPVQWPEDVPEDAPLQASYPPALWTEAEARWNSMTAEEQQQRTEEQQAAYAALAEQFEGGMREFALRESFSGWDLLWFGLAAYTAFSLGSGMASDE